MDDLYQIPAGERKLMLENMLHSPAFALFTDKWNEVVIEQVEKKIFDVNTSDEETRLMKRVRTELMGTHHPRAIVETILRSTKIDQPKPK
jgi:hypothetical protein